MRDIPASATELSPDVPPMQPQQIGIPGGETTATPDFTTSSTTLVSPISQPVASSIAASSTLYPAYSTQPTVPPQPATRHMTSETSKPTPSGSTLTEDAAVPAAFPLQSQPEITPAPKTPAPKASLASSKIRDESAAAPKPGANALPAQQAGPSDGEASAAPALVPSPSLPTPLAQHAAATPAPDPEKSSSTALTPPGGQPVAAGIAEPNAPPRPAQPAAPTQTSPGDFASRNAVAAQVTPALVHIATAADGAQRVTVKLSPVELGEVRIHIERPADGPVQVTVEATRPETLRLLHQDEPALHRALDQAGLPSEGRVVVLQQSADGQSPDGGGSRQGAANSGQSSMGGQGERSGTSGWQWQGDAEEAQATPSRRQAAWMRAGIDITA